MQLIKLSVTEIGRISFSFILGVAFRIEIGTMEFSSEKVEMLARVEENALNNR